MVDDDARSLCGQALGDTCTNAARCAGHDSYLSA
jgi:hypothetical protein